MIGSLATGTTRLPDREEAAMADNEAGTVLTCSNPDCDCRLRIEQPCPHGDAYTCACGHPFEAASD